MRHDRILYPALDNRDEFHYRHGDPGSVAPEGMRKLSAEELAINTVWVWSQDLNTWVSDEFPTGMSS